MSQILADRLFSLNLRIYPPLYSSRFTCACVPRICLATQCCRRTASSEKSCPVSSSRVGEAVRVGVPVKSTARGGAQTPGAQLTSSCARGGRVAGPSRRPRPLRLPCHCPAASPGSCAACATAGGWAARESRPLHYRGRRPARRQEPPPLLRGRPPLQTDPAQWEDCAGAPASARAHPAAHARCDPTGCFL